MSPGPDVSRRRRAERVRQEIFDNALKLLTETGLDKLSLRELARRMGYSTAALYEYFASKEDLIAALAIEADRRLDEALRNAVNPANTAEKLQAIGVAYLRFALENPHLYELYASTFSHRGDPGSLDLGGSACYLLFLKEFQAALDTGTLSPQPFLGAAGMAYTFWALLHGLACFQTGDNAAFMRSNSEAIARLLQGFK